MSATGFLPCVMSGGWGLGWRWRLGGRWVQVASFDASCLRGPLLALSESSLPAWFQSENLGKMAEDQNEGQLANSWITHLFTLLISRLIMFHYGCIYYHLKVPVKPLSLEGNVKPGGCSPPDLHAYLCLLIEMTGTQNRLIPWSRRINKARVCQLFFPVRVVTGGSWWWGGGW